MLGADISFTINSSTYELTARLLNSEGDAIGTAKTVDLPLESMVVDADYDDTNKTIVLTLKNGQTTSFSVADLVSGLQTELNANNKLNPAFIDYDASHRAVSDTEKNTWDAKQNAISDLDTIRSGAAAGATAVQPSTMETALAGKQDSLSETQLAAVNSGITANKVSKIDSNISLVANRTVKNLLNIINTPSGTSQGITFVNNGDQSYTITGTSTSNDAYIDLMTLEAPFPEWLTAGTELGLRCSNSTARLLVIPRINGQYQPSVYAGVTDIASWVVPQNMDRLHIRFKVSDVGVSVNDNNVRGMICYKSLGEIDNNLVPGAISNSDLTRLEAEDRAALAEVVDSGAKNRLDFVTWAANVNVTRGTKTVSGNSITLTATGNDCSTKWNPSDSGEYNYKIPVTAGEKLVLSWNANTSTTGKGRVFVFYSGVAETSVYTDANNKALEATIPSGCTFITFRFGVETNGDSITYSNIMLCTKAAFNVSPKFVPYQTIPKVILNSRTEFTSATTMTYTGVSYYIPPNTSVRITANVLNSHGNPVEAAIASYANQNIYLAYNEMPTDKTIGANTVSFMYTTTDSGYTVAVLAKFSNATTNYVHLVVEKLN